jgi:hypothetical protein
MTERRLKRIGAAAGIAYPLVQLTAQGLIQVGGVEPAFTAPASEILTFFESRDPTLSALGGFLSVFSTLLLLWFLGVLWDAMHASESGSGWLSVVAVGSGLLAATSLVEGGGWALALFRLEEGLEAQTARLLFDEGNLGFANSWIPIGSLVLAAGLQLSRAASFPRWLGAGSVLVSAGLFLARLVWTSQIAFLPYVLFWVWMIAVGILLWRRAVRQS